MNKKILNLLLFLFIVNSLFSQYTITGQFKDNTKKFESMLLYKNEGAFQYYKLNSAIDENGLFGFSLPENFEKGSYKLVFDSQNDKYVHIIFNNENITFVCNPEDVVNTITFFESEENTLYFDYIRAMNTQYIELDEIQDLCYGEPKNSKLKKEYGLKLLEITAFQEHFEEKSKDKLVHHFIVANKKHLSEKPLESRSDYYKYMKDNFLNAIDFQNPALRNSSFLLNRTNDYIFDLNEAVSNFDYSNLDFGMVDFALEKIEESKFKNELIYSITNSAFDPYSSQYDFLLEYIFNNYYKKLPAKAKNENFTKMVEGKLNAIVGKKATDITIGKTSLYSLKADSFLVIFWSTTCSHCLKEIPKVYEMLSDNKSIEVVLVGLEEEYSDWENVVKSFPKWKNVRANGKWTNKYAKAYNVKGTPAYFILDKDKNIVSKPDKLVDLEKIFDK